MLSPLERQAFRAAAGLFILAAVLPGRPAVAMPRAGEIAVRGEVRSTVPEIKSLVLTTFAFTLPGKAERAILPPRPKQVLVDAGTLIHVRGDAAHKLTFNDLAPGVKLIANGKDAGTGRALAAREIEVWTRIDDDGNYRFTPVRIPREAPPLPNGAAGGPAVAPQVIAIDGAPIDAITTEAPTIPFTMPWEGAGPSLTDVSFLNAAPAGAHGFIVAKGGHFVESGTGQRIRFLGVNFTGASCFPEHADAEKVSLRLARFGINLVRLKGIDSERDEKGSILAASAQTLQTPQVAPAPAVLDAARLERLDYLVAQLKEHGIYVSLPLHVYRVLGSPESLAVTREVPVLGKILTGLFKTRQVLPIATIRQLPLAARAAAFFDPKLIGLQKEYARDLLTHVNPYTHTAYVAEPALLSVQLTQENGLLGDPLATNDLGELPQPFADELRGLWNAWLAQKYGATSELKRAWAETTPPPGENLLPALSPPLDPFAQVAANGQGAWFLDSFGNARNTAAMEGDAIRLQVDKVTDKPYYAQFYKLGLDLKEGQPYTVHYRARADAPREMQVQIMLDQADWHYFTPSQPVHLTRDWQTFEYSCTPANVVPEHGRLVFTIGQQTGTIWLKDVELRQGVPQADALEGGALEQKGVSLPHSFGRQERADWAAFLLDTERQYAQTMRAYLKDDLKAQALVTCSQVWPGPITALYREAGMDYTDSHLVWDGPHYSDPLAAEWYIGNTSMLGTMATHETLARLAERRLADKPYVLSEYNHPAPGLFQAECVPLLASFAAFQDWDAIELDDFGEYGAGADLTKIQGPFAVGSNPAKWAFLPTAAALFRMGGVPPATGSTSLYLADKPADLLGDPLAPGLARQEEMVANSVTQFRLAVVMPGANWETAGTPSPAIEWSLKDDTFAHYVVNTPNVKIVAGRVGTQHFPLRDASFLFGHTPNLFAVVSLASLDGKPLATSEKALLTTVDRVENTGMQWNPIHNSVGEQWGNGPTLIDPVPIAIQLKTDGPRRVYALDGTGAARKEVPTTYAGGMLRFNVGQEGTLWYAIMKTAVPGVAALTAAAR